MYVCDTSCTYTIRSAPYVVRILHVFASIIENIRAHTADHMLIYTLRTYVHIRTVRITDARGRKGSPRGRKRRRQGSFGRGCAPPHPTRLRISKRRRRRRRPRSRRPRSRRHWPRRQPSRHCRQHRRPSCCRRGRRQRLHNMDLGQLREWISDRSTSPQTPTSASVQPGHTPR